MPTFKCKMCGGALEITPGATICECEYCGTTQTLPRLEDDRRANLYDRANHFRRNNDYDKAAGIYERILNEDNTDAEAYWSLVLCRYGIEYVEDPATHKRIPTVNRAQYTSIYADEDYKSAIQNADLSQKAVYEAEAKAIDTIQKGILEISQKEKPFDVFICYKETDANGRRTRDSVLANDLYHQLVQEDFKVFFSRITLEDKLGTAYEPYIFAALNSAKVMVVLGTKPEYFNAVWVKNEWSRYLALIRSGARKMLIPAYRDMDPYDLPEEFSHLQAQDMSKLGFMQDLIRGIKKIIGESAPSAAVAVKETVVVNTPAQTNIAPLLKRAFMFLEDGDWSRADDFCEQVLNQDPENAQAYLGKLMAELKVRKQDDLKDCDEPFDDSNDYQKAVRFGDKSLGDTLRADIARIKERNEKARLTEIYKKAVETMGSADSEAAYKSAAELLKSVPGFEDADELTAQCLENAEVCRKQAEQKAEELRITKEKAAKKRKQLIAISIPIIAACAIIVALVKTIIIPAIRYNSAVGLMEKGDYVSAIATLEELNGYKKSREIIIDCKYEIAVNMIDSGDYIGAYEGLTALDGYKDSEEIAQEICCQYNIAKMGIANVGDYVRFGTYEQDNDTSNGAEAIEWLVLDKTEDKILVISEYALDIRQYNTGWANITWEKCELRTWLNESFLITAFNTEEQKKIATTRVIADPHRKFKTNPGNDVDDNLFLLSASEVEIYMDDDQQRIAAPTTYACAQNPNTDDESTCVWWLRTPGKEQFIASIVDRDGTVNYEGLYADSSSGAVRPAMWISLE